MELIIVERKNGMYGGYEIVNKEIHQLFNTNAQLLFFSIKNYTDKGYRVKCISEKEFYLYYRTSSRYKELPDLESFVKNQKEGEIDE